MTFFRNLKLQTKLLLLFSLMSLVGTFGVGIGLYRINDMRYQVDQLAEQSGLLADIADVQAQVLIQQKAVSDFAATGDALYLDRYLQARQLAADAMTRAQTAAALTEYTPEEVAALEAEGIVAVGWAPLQAGPALTQVGADMAAFDAAVQPLFDPEFAGPQEAQAAAASILAAEQARLDGVQRTLSDLVYSQRLGAEYAAQEGEFITNGAIRFGVWVLLIFCGLAVAAALVTNRIADPILNLTNAIVAFHNNAYRPAMLAEYVDRQEETGRLAHAVDHMAQSITREAQRQQQMLKAANRFVPVSYVDFLAKQDITQIELGDHVSGDMPIMFTDIRSFSALSEKMTAAENFTFINDYLKTISPAIREHNGALVKFVGDGMMSVFPFGVEDALQAAVGQLEAVARFNAERTAEGLPATGLGIGMHVGPMMLGMVGEENRMQGDAFSDNVNLTSRIEGLNKFFGTNFIMSEETRSRLPHPEQYEMRVLGKVRVKGRVTPIVAYEVMTGDFTASDGLKVETRERFEEALHGWWAGDFERALPLFEEVAAANPDDVTANYYRTESRRLLQEGAPEDWDGVLVMVSK